ncbi:MAG: SPOR domain-containing protein, partial [Succinivibrio sp.]|nr:SPOR domain-containing protein [Succinivibrio sp.]
LKGIYIQLVACNSDTLATRIQNDAKQRIKLPVIVVNSDNINRVLVGPLTEAKAQSALSALKGRGFSDCFIKRFN